MSVSFIIGVSSVLAFSRNSLLQEIKLIHFCLQILEREWPALGNFILQLIDLALHQIELVWRGSNSRFKAPISWH